MKALRRYLGGLLVLAGTGTAGYVVASQQHAPRPSEAAAGSLGPSRRPRTTPKGPETAGVPNTGHSRVEARQPVARSRPVSIAIPAIGVRSVVNEVGLNPEGGLAVPPLNGSAATNEAAWYKYSPTPGETGPSVIVGHVDSAAAGPSVFFRLGALRPGDRVDVRLADGHEAIFRVDGVRQYLKARFPTETVYGNTDFAALRLISCSGAFDYATGHYLSNVVVYASLVGPGPARRPSSAGG